MYVTSLIVEAPDQLATTQLVRDDGAAVKVLRQMYPAFTQDVVDDDVVHRLAYEGIQVRIGRHDLAPFLGDGIPASPYGDLRRFSTYLTIGDDRQGQYLRPATAMEAAMSLSCARLDGGAGVFGVRVSSSSAATAVGEEETEFLHYGSRAWQQALVGRAVRYYRVENVPTDAVLPDVTAVRDEELPAADQSD